MHSLSLLARHELRQSNRVLMILRMKMRMQSPRSKSKTAGEVVRRGIGVSVILCCLRLRTSTTDFASIKIFGSMVLCHPKSIAIRLRKQERTVPLAPLLYDTQSAKPRPNYCPHLKIFKTIIIMCVEIFPLRRYLVHLWDQYHVTPPAAQEKE